MSESNSNLNDKLEDQKNNRILDLTDFKIKDEDCNILTEFLKNNQNFQSIILRGNNITGKGLEKITENAPEYLEFLNLELTNINKDFELLIKLIQKTSKLRVLDLKNNNIIDDHCSKLSEIIRSNNSLESIDLRYNKITLIGGQYIVNALRQNMTLLEIQLENNEISETLLNEIIRLLRRNSILLREKKIEQEYPIKKEYLKELCSKELDMEKLIRVNMENENNRLKEISLRNNSIKAELYLKYNNIISENTALNAELSALKYEIMNLHQKGVETTNILEDRLRESTLYIQNVRNKYEKETNDLLTEQDFYLKEVVNDWEQRFLQLNEAYNQTNNIKSDLEYKLNEIKENELKIRMNHEENLREMGIKLLLEHQKNYENEILITENQLVDIKNSNKIQEIKNNELNKTLEKNEKKIFRDIISKEDEIVEFKLKINELHHKLTHINIKIEDLKNKHLIQDLSYEKIHDKINEMENEIEKEKIIHKDKVNFLYEEHKAESHLWNVANEHQEMRILELEKLINNKNDENKRLKIEYEKICRELQNNVGRNMRDCLTIFQKEKGMR